MFAHVPKDGGLAVGDGYGTSFPGLGVSRVDAVSGEETARVKLRHQLTHALVTSGRHVYASTDNRLFELDQETLEIRRQWQGVLPRFSQQMVFKGGLLIGANWLSPMVSLFDLTAEQTRRKRYFKQLILGTHAAEIVVGDGQRGGTFVLDTQTATLSPYRSTPPMRDLAFDEDDLWITVAEPVQTTTSPPLLSPLVTWRSNGTVLRLRADGSVVQAKIGESIRRFAIDRERNLVWCVTDPDHRTEGGGGALVWFAIESGRIVGSASLGLPASFLHVDPIWGVALAETPSADRQSGDLACYGLDDLVELPGAHIALGRSTTPQIERD